MNSRDIFIDFSKTLMSNKPSVRLRDLARTGFYLPYLQQMVDFKADQGKYHYKDVWNHTLQVVDSTPKILEVRWAALYHDIAKPVTYSVDEETGSVHFLKHENVGEQYWYEAAKFMDIEEKFKNDVGKLVLNHLLPALFCQNGPKMVRDNVLRKLVQTMGDQLDNLFHLSLADITSHNPVAIKNKADNCKALKRRVDALIVEDRKPKVKLPKGLGFELMKEFNLGPGKELGELMQQLHTKLLKGELNNESNFIEAAKSCRQLEK